MIGDEALLELLIPPTPVHDAYERRLDVKDDRISELKDEVDELEEEVEDLREEINELDSDEDVVAVRDDVSSEGNDDERPSEEDDGDNGEERTEGDGTGETFVATYYTATCDTGCTGVTATGIDVTNSITHEGRRIIAADPSVLPFGTVVRVSTPHETFEATVQDSGGDITSGRIDILVGSKEEAVSNGRHDVRVEVIG